MAGKYVYWFKLRQSGTYSRGDRQGFYGSKIYFSKLKDAKKYREEHKIQMYTHSTGKTETTYPKMHKVLKTNVSKNTHIN